MLTSRSSKAGAAGHGSQAADRRQQDNLSTCSCQCISQEHFEQFGKHSICSPGVHVICVYVCVCVCARTTKW